MHKMECNPPPDYTLRLPLGAYPNIEPCVARPDQCILPEPSEKLKSTKQPIIGDITDADVIDQFDDHLKTSPRWDT